MSDLLFRNKTTGELVDEYTFRSSYPNVSFPNTITQSTLDGYDFDLVTRVDRPTITSTQTVTYTVTKIDGEWIEQWTVTDITDPDQLAAIRAQDIQNLLGDVSWQVQTVLDNFARTKLYDNIVSACSYAVSTNAQYLAEGLYCVKLRDDMWSQCYSIIADVISNVRPTIPTAEQLMSELPVPTWP